MAIGKLFEVVIDCHDCDSLAAFWAAVPAGRRCGSRWNGWR